MSLVVHKMRGLERRYQLGLSYYPSHNMRIRQLTDIGTVDACSATGIKERLLLGMATARADIFDTQAEPRKLGGVTMTHYHIRWSGKVLLDWQRFDTPEEAQASARQLVRHGETYTIEEHDEACPRCQAAMNTKSMHGDFNAASA